MFLDHPGGAVPQGVLQVEDAPTGLDVVRCEGVTQFVKRNPRDYLGILAGRFHPVLLSGLPPRDIAIQQDGFIGQASSREALQPRVGTIIQGDISASAGLSFPDKQGSVIGVEVPHL